MAVASLVGLVAGLGAVGFALLIDGVHWFFVDLVVGDGLSALPSWRVLLAPALGAILVGPITRVFAPEARGAGVPEVMLAVETRGGRIRRRVAVAKAIASALTLGSGGSVGKEGPIVQIGSAFGSMMGQALRLSDENLKLLVAAGAAAGIAATFNAPIAGVFFSLEVILRRFNTRNFSVVVLASVVATVTAVVLRGDAPAIPIPAYRLEHATEIPLYAILGGLVACGGVAFIHVLYWTEDRFTALRFPPQLWMPVVGGLIVGTLGLVDSGVLGLGEQAMDDALSGGKAAQSIALLFFLKLLATSVTIGSGGSGGVFHPSLFMGAMLGGGYGGFVHALLPGLTAPAGAYATAGMAAMIAATARAPITSVLILFEMTRDYALILPLMTAVVTATVVSQLLSSGTVYTIKLRRRGVHIEEEAPTANLMQTLRVSDAMRPSLLTVARDMPVAEVARAMSDDREELALVVDEDDRLLGVISNTDVNEALAGGDEDAHAIDIASSDVITIFPDQTLHHALTVLAGRAVHALPVMLRERPDVPCGLLRRSDITNSYSTATEDLVSGLRRGRLTPVTSDDVRYLELRVGPGSILNHHLLSEVHITEDAVVVAIRRDGVTLIPRGHTRLEANDRVTVIAAQAAVEDVQAIFSGATVPVPRHPAAGPDVPDVADGSPTG
ncbi:MAG: chloride channel protein [Chloroflexi bacterium]|nr:chloride channel protein [Chloroflexota bacterium]MDA1003791.1 chloride channel protein [Chloroflexota bacterium]